MEQVAINLIADTTTLLSYVTNLLLTFIIAIAGAFTREVYNYKKKDIHISIFRLIASALLCSVTMTAVAEYTDLSFGVFALIAYFFGMWAFGVIEIIMNAKYIAIAVKDVFKELKNPLLKGTANAIEDIRKEKIKDDKEEKEKKEKEAKEAAEKKEKELSPEEEQRIIDEELLKQIRKLEAKVALRVENN